MTMETMTQMERGLVEFLERAAAKFPTFDYSKVKYGGAQTKVIIGCPTHGEFHQTPLIHIHTSRYGCPVCAAQARSKSNTWTTDQWRVEADRIHKGRWDYSSVNYTGRDHDVTVGCRLHGPFRVNPGKHIRVGHQAEAICRQCAIADLKCVIGKMTTESFIQRAEIIHGTRFDYSSSIYVTSAEKVRIICRKHNEEFMQMPSAHLIMKQCGCRSCVGEEVSARQQAKRDTIEDFRVKASVVHGGLYDYSETVLGKTSSSKVAIKCNTHGVFWQNASHHLRGCGCPRCKASRGEREVEKWLKASGARYQLEWTPPSMRSPVHGKGIRFDFWLPDAATVIEFDGAQHFNPMSFFGGEAGLGRIQERDAIKTAWCATNGIRLIRIKYTANVEETLAAAFGHGIISEPLTS